MVLHWQRYLTWVMTLLSFSATQIFFAGHPPPAAVPQEGLPGCTTGAGTAGWTDGAGGDTITGPAGGTGVGAATGCGVPACGRGN